MTQTVQDILDYTILSVKDYVFTIGDAILFLVILVLTHLLTRVIRLAISTNFKNKNVFDSGKEYALIKISKYFIYTIGIVISIESLGIDISIVLASSAALFVGIGLGLQQIFNDFVSGFILLFEGEIRKGDILEIDGNVGQVQQLDIRTTKIKTRDDIIIVVPNSKLTSNDVINWSHGSSITRFSIAIGVAYNSDLALVKNTLESVVKSHKDVIKTKPVIARFDDFANSSLNFQVFFWAQKNWEIELIKSDIRFSIIQHLRKNNITIPFPQRDIHIINQ